MLTVMLQATVLFLAVTWHLTKQSNIGQKCLYLAEHPDFNPLAPSVLSPLSDHPDTSNSFFKPCRISYYSFLPLNSRLLPGKNSTFFSFLLGIHLLCTFIVMLWMKLTFHFNHEDWNKKKTIKHYFLRKFRKFTFFKLLLANWKSLLKNVQHSNKVRKVVFNDNCNWDSFS